MNNRFCIFLHCQSLNLNFFQTFVFFLEINICFTCFCWVLVAKPLLSTIFTYLRFVSIPRTLHHTSAYFSVRNFRPLLYLLAHVFNYYFPICFEKPHDLRVHKSGNGSDVNRYRPINFLHTINNFFKYLLTFNFLANCHFGKKNVLTSNAVFDILHYFYYSLENCDCVISVFLDYRESFHSVDYEYLFQEMRF